MEYIRNHDRYYDPPDDDPICDSCGESLVRDIDGWFCQNKFCPIRFEGIEKSMADYILDLKDEVETLREQNHRLVLKLNSNP